VKLFTCFPKLQGHSPEQIWRLRLQECGGKTLAGFVLSNPISFGIALLLSIALILVAIFIIVTATNRDGDDSGDRGSSVVA